MVVNIKTLQSLHFTNPKNPGKGAVVTTGADTDGDADVLLLFGSVVDSVIPWLLR